ncbi:hypothetical protein DyAD56_11035 [Dyella sp. AD56]|nr:DUF4902 domain-containing protein [Dyella sp.]PMQ05199.1 hypothetical protein DyAD56_11035 [Dyella sp. AD56]
MYLVSNSGPIEAFPHQDGYQRLTFQDLQLLKFKDLMAFEDPTLCSQLNAEGIAASIAGFCEKLALHGDAQVSIGWAWFCIKDCNKWLAPGGVSSNIMLVDASGYDLGVKPTSDVLSDWISSQAW